MKLYVGIFGSTSQSIVMSGYDSFSRVGDVKRRLANLLGLPCANQISLVHEHKHLTDPDALLGHYGIAVDPCYLSMTVTIFVP